MFASIAERYDMLNRVLSMGRDHVWRKRAAALARPPKNGRALDVCCGTGELTRILATCVGPDGLVVGVDFCMEMLRRANEAGGRGCTYLQADALSLPFADGCFDCVTVAFGIRNVAEPVLAFTEMRRVVCPGGRVVCLEFGLPPDRFRRALVSWYERMVIPSLGGILSRREAYEYLSRSIAGFAPPHHVREMMETSGLYQVRSVGMHLGSVYAHVGIAP